ncbi:hypothetical protein N0V82_007381 [Gnomoniopsis sp. IMI 355080]|nr:hypothetical protein N0V82_007381 [Gnomoniopsis sp. IMI 355080]
MVMTVAVRIAQVLFYLAWAVVVRAQSTSSTASACVPSPKSVEIRNVSIANSPDNAVARGIAISIGTPAQDFAFMPYSFVFDARNNCGYGGNFPDVSNAACITWRGGAYLASASKTVQRSTNYTVTDPSPYPSTSAYSDLWTVGDEIALSTYSFGVPVNDWGEQYYTPQNLLGLGSQSTFLNDLKEAGIIGSRTWSIFWGLDGASVDANTNGSMVFGGYDKNKVYGANYTAKLNYTNCKWGIQAELSAFSMVDTGGTVTSMSAGDTDITEPLFACIDPAEPGMFNIPFDYFETFANHTNYTTYIEELGDNDGRSFGLNFFDLLYKPVDNRFGGQFKVTFQDGPTVLISNDQFVVPHIYVDDNSGLWSQDFSEYDLLINSGAIGGSNTTLGLNRHASTFIYTMVNLDAGEFTIWAANSESNTQSLVAVDTNNVIVDQASLCATSPRTALPSADTKSNSSNLSGGSIAGIAIGAVAAVSLLGLLGWWIFRRRRTESQRQPQPLQTQELHHLPGDDTDKFYVPGGMVSTGRNTLLSDFDASGTPRTVSTTASHQMGSHASELPALHLHHQQESRFELHG